MRRKKSTRHLGKRRRRGRRNEEKRRTRGIGRRGEIKKLIYEVGLQESNWKRKHKLYFPMRLDSSCDRYPLMTAIIVGQSGIVAVVVVRRGRCVGPGLGGRAEWSATLSGALKGHRGGTGPPQLPVPDAPATAPRRHRRRRRRH